MHLVYPATFCTTIVFACSQDNRNTLEKLEMMAMHFFFFGMGGGGGLNKVRNSVCEMVSAEISSKSLTFMVMFW